MSQNSQDDVSEKDTSNFSTIDQNEWRRLFQDSEDDTGTFDGFSETQSSDVGNVQDFSDSSSESNGSDISLSDVDSDSDNANDIDEVLDDDQLRNYEPEWTDVFSDFTVVPFSKNTGGNFPPTIKAESSTPVEYFSLFFNSVLINEILDNTNSYADWCFAAGQTAVNWKPVDIIEMKAFLGMCIIFGLVPVKCYKTYWNNDPFLGNVGIKSVMTRSRYEQINRFFHVSDRSKEVQNVADPAYDKLYKLRNVIKSVSANFLKFNNADSCQSIDEGMIAFKGRISYLQYMPAKVSITIL
jgi:hypothetical protein